MPKRLPSTDLTKGQMRYRLVRAKPGWSRLFIALEWLRSPLSCKLGWHVPDIEESTAHSLRNTAWSPCRCCGLLVEVPLDDLPDQDWVRAAIEAIDHGENPDEDEQETA